MEREGEGERERARGEGEREAMGEGERVDYWHTLVQLSTSTCTLIHNSSHHQGNNKATALR